MSSTTVKQLAISLFLPLVPGAKRDRFVAYMTVANSDGTAPTIGTDPQSPSNSSLQNLTQPTANDGTNPTFPPANFPWQFSGEAGAVGVHVIDLYGDNVLAEQITFTVANRDPEVPNVDQTNVVITQVP